MIPLLRFLDRLERKAPAMIDPDLAHLYADADDLEREELEELHALAARPTTLEELVAVAETLEEPLSEHDLEELAILVESKIAAGTFSDEEAAELGLGELRDLDGEDAPELVLNETGRAVVVRAALRRTSSLGSNREA